mmetsp:Transcript_4951/g.8063  ORF Transcript_4951/g.8063 Transcript_4951/m.8063 type:complete len:642 (+) Transcript_4951:42-1967(+)
MRRLRIIYVLAVLWGSQALQSFRNLASHSRHSVVHAKVSSPDISHTSTESIDSFKAPDYEIQRRRNFAIISHPDAGKTTLTEKLLLFGGAIQDAGAVKARADQRQSTSDWMEIEKQRGISVTSTVLSFEYAHNEHQYHLNLLDTPGHQDFSEDTYRTLAAADNCVMLIDAAKGIEDRTRMLFEVCKMRKLPVFSFANKLDRPSLSPFDVIDQIEKEFELECCPMNWPIGEGSNFQGVYDRPSRKIHLFERGDRRKKVASTIMDVDSPDVEDVIGADLYAQLLEDVEVLDSLINEPDLERIQNGEQTPLFFGSAMSNFGVELFLQTFLEYARIPPGRSAMVDSSATGGAPITIGTKIDASSSSSSLVTTDDGNNVDNNDSEQASSPSYLIEPDSEEFTGFVFKLQANLDPKHRDRMAFIRVCSGIFRKGMKVGHSRMKKSINLSSAQSLFAQDRESVTEAYPGDVIGIHNPGVFAIGDTIFTGNTRVAYPGIPSFSPEKFAYIRNPNPSTYKKFQKGLSELLDEGAVQMLRDRSDDGNGSPLLAAVGQLQFEVVTHRLQSEYGVESTMEPLGYTQARWVGGGWDAIKKAEEDGKLYGVYICQDRWNRPVLLFRNPWKVTQLTAEVEYLKLVPWAMPPTEFAK